MTDLQKDVEKEYLNNMRDYLKWGWKEQYEKEKQDYLKWKNENNR